MKGLIGHLVLAIALILAAGIVIGVVSFPELMMFLARGLDRLLSFAMQTIDVMGGG